MLVTKSSSPARSRLIRYGIRFQSARNQADGKRRGLRSLTALFVAALGVLMAPGIVSAGEYRFTRIADDSGTFAPFTSTPAPSIAPDGTVAFIATLDAGGITSVNTGDGGATTELVRTSFLGLSTITGPTSQDSGDAVYFLGQGLTSPVAIYRANTGGESVLYGGAGLSLHTVPRVNDGGVAAFRASAEQPIPGNKIYKGNGGVPTLVAMVGILGVVSIEPRPAIDANGVVAYLTGDGSGGAQILRNTDIAPAPTLIAGTTGDITEILGIPDLEEGGTVIFTALLSDGRVAIRSGDGGPLTTRVTTGPYFSDLSDPAIATPDAIAFWGELADGSGEGIFTGRDARNQAVVRTGDFLDGSTVVSVDFDPVGMNDVGQIAFRAVLADGRTGIYRAEPGSESRELRIEAAVAALQATSLVPPAFHFENGLFRSFFGKVPAVVGLPAVQAESFVGLYRDLFDWSGPLQSLEVERIEDLRDGDLVRMRQTYKGLRIFGSELNVAIEPDGTAGSRITGVVAAILPELPNLDVIPAFPPGPCIEAARAAFGDGSAQVVGETELMIFDGRLAANGPMGVVPGNHLVYRVHLAGVPGMEGFLVDANTAQVVYSYGLEPDASPLYDLLLEEAFGLTMGASQCFSPGSVYPDLADEDGTLPAGIGDPDVLALYQFAQGTWDFYANTFGRCSYNGSCGRVEIHVHASSSDPNARYSSACDEFEFTTGWPSRDVMTHEFTHGVIAHTSGLIYQDESGALNESYADTMGWIEDSADNLLAEDRIGNMGAIRSMSDPTLYGQPDTYSGYQDKGDGKDNDFGGVHFNSGITNKAHYLMAQGGRFNGIPVDPFPPIQGIGRNKLGNLVYDVMRVLPPWSSMPLASEVTLAVATQYKNLGAFTGQDLCDVRNALAAVELGLADSDCDGVADQSDDSDGDSIPDSLDNCPIDINYSQSDCDGNGTGNACEADTDGDGVPNGCDNCVSDKNYYQIDTDGDGAGDACDNDWDNDGVTNGTDNCPFDPNPGQQDTDGEGTGDACDVDLDDDGWYAFTDNCPFTPNPGQEDADGDGKGDACDGCPATDDPASGYTFGIPELGVDPQPIEPDADADGTPDACDPFAFGPAALQVDNNLFNPSFAVVPIGGHAKLTLSTPADTMVEIPIDICDPTTPSTMDNTGRFELVATGLDPAFEVALVDAARTRRTILSDDIDGERGLWVWPDCGRKWYLQFYADSFSGDDTFNLSSAYVAQTASGNPWTQEPGLGVPPQPLPDLDGDGLVDDIDTCPGAYDPTNADADGDSLGDVCDNCTQVPNPSQCDGDNDGYGNDCDADFNNDGIVNNFDVGPFKAGLGTTNPVTDLNCDGITNNFDVGPFKAMLGHSPGPSGLVP